MSWPFLLWFLVLSSLSMCFSQFRFSLSITPRYLAEGTFLISTFSIYILFRLSGDFDMVSLLVCQYINPFV